MKIIVGRANRLLGERLCEDLGISSASVNIGSFADGETYVEVCENVRGEDVYVVQSTSYPANENLLELLLMIDALKRGSASRITAVIPYYGYARQDRKTSPRSPISAKLVANLIVEAGASRVLTMDLHAGQIQGFFEVPTDNLFARPEQIKRIREDYEGRMGKILLVSPDVGGVARTRGYAKHLNAPIAIIDKRRKDPGSSEVMNIVGMQEDKHCIMIDDIVDSATTLCSAARVLKDKGALSVSAYVVHGVLSGDAVVKIEESNLERMVITDSISLSKEKELQTSKIEELSVANLIGEAMRRISLSQSVSSLFS